MWVNRGTFGIPSHILPFRAGTPLRAFSDTLRYATGDAKVSSLRALPPLFVARSARSSPPLSAKTCDGLGALARFARLCRLLRLIALPLRAGTPLRAFSDTLRYASGDAKISPLRALPPL